MTEKHENRRVRMTKALIKNALLELLEQQELTNITVTAVCEAADVHRSTFYKYYTDTADLMKEIEQDLMDQIPKPHPDQTQAQLLKDATAFFDYVKQNEKAFRILFSDSTSNHFFFFFFEFLSSGYIPVPGDYDNFSIYFMQRYIAYATAGMLKEWIRLDFPVSSQKMAELMYFLSTKVIA